MTTPIDPLIQYRDNAASSNKEGSLSEIFNHLFANAGTIPATFTASTLTAASFYIGANQITFGATSPSTGTWVQGDVCFNTGATAGGSPGWICIVAGTPGTWKAMGNVAS